MLSDVRGNRGLIVLLVVAIAVLGWPLLQVVAQDEPSPVTMFGLMERQTALLERLVRAEERQATALEHIERELERR